jgi:aminopeptidase Q
LKENTEEKNLHWELDNSEVRGYFRVQYDNVGWARLMQQLQNNPESISLEAKMQLMSDAVATVT